MARHIRAARPWTRHANRANKAHAYAEAVRAVSVGALALGMIGFVAADQFVEPASAWAQGAQAAGVWDLRAQVPGEGEWNMRAEAPGLSARDFSRSAAGLSALASFTVEADGASVQIQSNVKTLAQALAANNILVGERDVVSEPMNALPPEGTVVRILRVGESEEVEQVVDKHATSEVKTDTLFEGERRVATRGVDGLVVTTYTTVLLDGVEQSRQVLAQVALRQRVDEVVEVGTKPRPEDGPNGAIAPAHVNAGDPVGIGQEMAAARGWTGNQWSCLYSLWQKESNWNPMAKNRSSGAYGIPQALPGAKMASHGADWATNPATQVAWGLDYIAKRYGTPCAAWNHSVAKNWY